MFEVVIVCVIILAFIWYVSQPANAATPAPETFIGDKHSRYGNISARDIDLLATDHNFASALDVGDARLSTTPEDALDNSAAVMQMFAKQGPSVFQPNQLGVTATNYGGQGSFAMAEPGYHSRYTLPQTGVDADEQFARQQQYLSSKNKRAMDGNFRTTRAVFNKFFVNELNECEGRDWWDATADTMETDWDA